MLNNLRNKSHGDENLHKPPNRISPTGEINETDSNIYIKKVPFTFESLKMKRKFPNQEQTGIEGGNKLNQERERSGGKREKGRTKGE